MKYFCNICVIFYSTHCKNIFFIFYKTNSLLQIVYKKWNKEILNSFKTSYTNSSTEGKNNKIKVIKRIAYGYKNLDNFRNRIKLMDLKV